MSELTQNRAVLRYEHAYRIPFTLLVLAAIAGIAFAAGIFWGSRAHAAESGRDRRVVYPKKTELDFEGLAIQGEVRSPGEFYFQHRTEEKFDSLVKRRKNFHREMLRDVVLSK